MVNFQRPDNPAAVIWMQPLRAGRVYRSKAGMQRLSAVSLSIGILFSAEGFVCNRFGEAEAVAE
ncbi:hypothetical protein D3C80_1777680 [compost metagenome]